MMIGRKRSKSRGTWHSRNKSANRRDVHRCEETLQYSAAAADHKGARLESNSFSFQLGGTNVIPGFQQGVTGMKVGGKRTIEVPASLAYGERGSNGIPGNNGLVFEITLTKVE